MTTKSDSIKKPSIEDFLRDADRAEKSVDTLEAFLDRLNEAADLDADEKKQSDNRSE